MSENKKTNFEKMADDGRRLFLEHGDEGLAGKYGTTFDDVFLYIRFIGRDYRIGRDSGVVETQLNKGTCWIQAGPGEAMTLYDVFCYGQPLAHPSGEFVNHNSLVHQISASSNPGGGLYINHLRRFEGKSESLKTACEPLGGTFLPKGDVSFELPMFDFLKCRFQYWEADDEFPASIEVFLDKNILQYMHFETTWYASICLLGRIAEEAGL